MLKVLLVDDNGELLVSAARFLRQRGLDVDTSGSALGVSHKIRANRPDLVVLDVMMPEVGGGSLAAFLQNMEAMKDVPILFYSAMDEEELHELARQHGVGYVSKTDGLPALFEAIQAQTAGR
jgi:CheY-like chemotaxis protein